MIENNHIYFLTNYVISYYNKWGIYWMNYNEEFNIKLLIVINKNYLIKLI